MKLPIACPGTHQDLRVSGHECVGTGISYPMVGDIPWLFPDPKHILGDWRGRASLLLDHLEKQVSDLKIELKKTPSNVTRERLDTLRKLRIRHLEMLRRTLEPLKPSAKMNLNQKKAYGYRLPLRQGLLGYFPNLVRDWSGRYENENQILFDSVTETLKKAKPILDSSELRILILGAGGSRLAYDLAKKFTKAQVIAFDLNPILLLAAKKIAEGARVAATDFSVSPKDSRQPGQEVELFAPSGPAENLHFVFGDVYALPFQTSSFDICVSPWLVDILPRRFQDLCASVARVVHPKGVWVNSGSWHFSFANESENLSLDEASEVARDFGWAPLISGQLETPYLQSPFDAHRRFETLTQFCWERTAKEVTAQPPIDDRADWIRNPSLAVPPLAEFGDGTTTHALMALVLSLVDGQRTLGEIADIVSKENGLGSEEALDATQSFFDRFLKDRHFREG